MRSTAAESSRISRLRRRMLQPQLQHVTWIISIYQSAVHRCGVDSRISRAQSTSQKEPTFALASKVERLCRRLLYVTLVADRDQRRGTAPLRRRRRRRHRLIATTSGCNITTAAAATRPPSTRRPTDVA